MNAQTPSLWRTTPFRMGLMIAGTALVSYLVIILLVGTEVRSRIQEINDRSILEVFRLIKNQTETTGIDGLADGVNAILRERGTNRLLILVRQADGQPVVGNMTPLALTEEWSTVPGPAVGHPEVKTFRFHAGAIGPFQVVVGASNDEVEETLSVISSVLGWSGTIALVIALAFAAWAARGIQRRQSLFQSTMSRIAEGDLKARIPLSGQDDDIDRLSASINAALDRLESGVDAMKQVSSDIAHDLRTPLGRLERHLGETMSRIEAGGDPRDPLQAAISESENIEQTFDALLRISQIESGARRAHFAKVDLRALCSDVAESYVPVAEDAGMTLETLLPEAPVPVSGDRELLVQSLVNLIENAIRHCPPGTRITCRLTPGPGPTLSVRDTGAGLPAEERAKVTRRHYRADKSRFTPGSGLGLALVKAVADLHAAELSIDDAAPGLVASLTFGEGG